MPADPTRAIAPWGSILGMAIHTPSPHNTQPWRVLIHDERTATLYMERARMLPDEDITGHFLQCAMGMFIESVRIVAANAGYSLRDERIEGAERNGMIPFAKLELSAGSNPSGYADDLIGRRATSRLGSNGPPIPAEITVRLKSFEPERGQRYHQIDDARVIESLVRENIRAVFHDLNVKPYHDEIARWFRYSDAEAQSKADGLDYRCMRVPSMELRLMRRLPQIMRWPILRNIMARVYRIQLGRFDHIGLIAGNFFDNNAAVKAGAFLMRFWLQLARENLFIHPFGNLVTNLESRARVEAITGIKNVWLVFRIGHTDAPPRSLRRSVEEVLLNA